MDKLLSNNHFEISNGDKIININSLANKKIERGEKVINATVGMLYDENHELVSFSLVNQALKDINFKEAQVYGKVDGGEKFYKSVYKWLFENVNLEGIYCAIVPSIGATGAIYLSVRNYCSKDQDVIVSSIRWSNYDSIISQLGNSVKEYNFFNSDDYFDIESFKDVVNQSCSKYKRAYIIINDPCHNPTGYTLSKNEWIEILSFLNDKSLDYQIVLLVDIAYINYCDNSYEEIFTIMSKFLTENFMIQFTFSSSKTLSIYGFRGGALIGLSSKEEIINDFKKACEDTLRATWALPNNLTNKVIDYCFDSKEKRSNLRKELLLAKEILDQRAKLFIKESEIQNLIVYPYNNGFFVLVPCEKANIVCNDLIRKNIFVVPMSGGLRIALSSICKEQIRPLVKEIKESIKAVDH